MTGAEPAAAPAAAAATPARPTLIPLGGDAALCEGDTCVLP
ncbi:hypothetical protein [Leifsonia sp. 21MFCrub1.1]|nr:hypothetical protein [Leifsonia sp. 21MFCrub1.1]SEA83170.1 hypothetical protein SAMN04515680_1735 [Leifsonia sp. 21MFCrub1.1]